LSKERLIGLDLIRGLCAVSVMVYHYAYYSGLGNFAAAGTYAVYIFFVLSGFTLFYVYGEKPLSSESLKDFFLARAFRIMPLYTAVVTYQLFSNPITFDRFSQYLVNVSLLFGLSNPGTTSMTPGGWSIGIEAVFYLLFPVVLLFRSVKALAALTIATFMLHFIYVHAIYSNKDIVSTWSPYTQAITFLCYFVAGVLAARVFHLLPKFGGSIWLSLATLLAIVTLPHLAGWDRVTIIADWPSALMIALSIGVVVLGARARITGAARKVAVFLGDISYSLYLLHLVVFFELKLQLGDADTLTLLAASTAVTLVLSKLLYTYFETPARRLRHARSPVPASPMRRHRL